MEVFADTSFFIAYTSPRDRFHRGAVAAMLTCEGRIVTTDWVLVELGNFFGGGRDRNKFAPFVSALRADPRILILPADQSDLEAGLRLYAERLDKRWSLVDCISFRIMDKRKIQEAYTSDHHFEQAGFTAVLRSGS